MKESYLLRKFFGDYNTVLYNLHVYTEFFRKELDKSMTVRYFEVKSSQVKSSQVKSSQLIVS